MYSLLIFSLLVYEYFNRIAIILCNDDDDNNDLDFPEVVKLSLDKENH